MKKILFIITQSEFGGAQRFLWNLISGLTRIKTRIDADIVVGAGLEGDDKNGLLYALEKKGINTRHLKYLRRGINPLFDFLGLIEIRKLIKKEKPDTLFLCSSKAGFLGSFAAHLCRRNTQIDLASQDTQKHADADKEFLYSDITYKIRGACFKVWKQFRGAFKEKIIENALVTELENYGLKVETQKRIPISYEGKEVGVYVPDAIVDDKVLIELKSKSRLTKEDQKQFWLYLKGSKYKLGLLINFGKQLEIKRKVYDIARNNSASISVLPKAQNQRVSAKSPRVIYRIGGWTFNDPWPYWKRLFYKLIEKISAKWKDVIIVNSEHDRKQAVELGIKPMGEILTIYNGIDVSKLNFLPREKARKELLQDTRYKIQDTNYLIGTIANLYSAKGLEYLIKAADILKYKIQDTRYKHTKFVVIGEGRERKKLENLIKKYKLKNSFFLPGAIPDAYKYLKAFDIFVLPSVKEGFPWTILEAMAAEVPIVATKVGGIPEIIEDNRNGIIVKPRSSRQLAEAAKELIKNPELRNKLSREARKTVEQKFTLDKMVNKIEKLL